MVEMQGSDRGKDLGLDSSAKGHRANFCTSKSCEMSVQYPQAVDTGKIKCSATAVQ